MQRHHAISMLSSVHRPNLNLLEPDNLYSPESPLGVSTPTMPLKINPIPTLLALLILILLHHTIHSSPTTTTSPHPVLPANFTLGFGTILAVSHTTSPRRPALLWAANLTSIDITIPTQPTWTDSDIEAFKAKEGYISNGSARAWMGHLHVLKYFLNTTHETALILEDDTDFSLHIRTTQIPLLAAAMRTLTNTPISISPSQNPTTNALANSNENKNPNYWSPPNSWDLLYPGHCDDLLTPLYYTPNTPSTPSSPPPQTTRLTYSDPTSPTPHHPSFHPQTSLFLTSLSVPAHARILHRTQHPFCTFAYGVTRSSAARIVRELVREREGGVSAFDVALLEKCRDDDGEGWRCWSVGGEVFHHGRGRSEIGSVDWGVYEDTSPATANTPIGGEAVGRSEGEEKKDKRATWNIQCGARHAQLWVGEDDQEGRRRMKRFLDKMVERGECGVDFSAQERSWKGCEGGECGAQS
ncbi:hypothetical protein NX059_010039 [Plenodomus lindquistii]|nr:hypothetical protein NX059_010039 [Plenodomus lindquistii]